jgi:hypothetical protein
MTVKPLPDIDLTHLTCTVQVHRPSVNCMKQLQTNVHMTIATAVLRLARVPLSGRSQVKHTIV